MLQCVRAIATREGEPTSPLLAHRSPHATHLLSDAFFLLPSHAIFSLTSLQFHNNDHDAIRHPSFVPVG
jgi:hypothetical protein